MTRSERKFRGLSLDATMLSDSKLQLAVLTGDWAVSLAALLAAHCACGALAFCAGG